jgi:hypothetical protein
MRQEFIESRHFLTLAINLLDGALKRDTNQPAVRKIMDTLIEQRRQLGVVIEPTAA